MDKIDVDAVRRQLCILSTQLRPDKELIVCSGIVLIDQLTAERDEARKEVERLQDRLEVPEPPISPAYDGISCRDETINLQDGRIDALQAKLDAMQVAVVKACTRAENRARCSGVFAYEAADYVAAPLRPFLPKPEPDPLVEAVNEAWGWRNPHRDVTENLRQALAKRGYVVMKGEG